MHPMHLMYALKVMQLNGFKSYNIYILQLNHVCNNNLIKNLFIKFSLESIHNYQNYNY